MIGETQIEVFVYNFDKRRVGGVVEVEHAPAGWELSPRRWEVKLEAMERKLLPIRISAASGEGQETDGWIKLRGNFSQAGRPVLAFKLERR